MKKLIPIILLICMCMTGCGSSTSTITEKDTTGRFQVVLAEAKGFGGSVQIVVDSETDVMYMFTKSGYGGGLSVMLDAEGKPMLWSENKEAIK